MSLTRRDFVTKGGLFLAGASLLGACNSEPYWNYSFDLSELEGWQAYLFLEAGKNPWQVNDGRNDNSGNKVSFGKLPKESDIARVYSHEWKEEYGEFYGRNLGKWLGTSEEKLMKQFRVVFRKEITNWVDCNVEGEIGQDFLRIAQHEWGHILGYGHSNNPKDIMFPTVPQRCQYLPLSNGLNGYHCNQDYLDIIPNRP